jgi:hypothetical protein
LVLVLDVKLDEGVSAQQFEDYWMKNTIPSYEKEYKAEIYLADGLRGQEEGKICMI